MRGAMIATRGHCVGVALLSIFLLGCTASMTITPKTERSTNVELRLRGKIIYDGNREYLPRTITQSSAERFGLTLRYAYDVALGKDNVPQLLPLFNPLTIVGFPIGKDTVVVTGRLDILKGDEVVKSYSATSALDSTRNIFWPGETYSELRRKGLVAVRDNIEAQMQRDRDVLSKLAGPATAPLEVQTDQPPPPAETGVAASPQVGESLLSPQAQTEAASPAVQLPEPPAVPAAPAPAPLPTSTTLSSPSEGILPALSGGATAPLDTQAALPPATAEAPVASSPRVEDPLLSSQAPAESTSSAPQLPRPPPVPAPIAPSPQPSPMTPPVSVEPSGGVPVAAPPTSGAPSQASTSPPTPAMIEVIISYPEDRSKVAADAVALAGVVTAPKGVARVAIAVNGTELPSPESPSIVAGVEKTRALNTRIPLQIGENVIAVTVFDQSGAGRQVVRTVYREPSTAGGLSLLPRPPGGSVVERWGVVIGIDQYRDPDIAGLRYAVADAQAMYDFLITKGGVRPQNARLLLNKEATQRNIRRTLGEFLKQKALKDDEVIIYYAGHGTVDPDPGTEGGLAKYLVPWDADSNSLFSTAIPMEEIDRIFARIAARKILLVQDTCFSGGAGGRTFLRKNLTRAGTISDKFLQDLAERQGRMILTASDANQVSLEDPERGHGLFTYYLLQAFEGAADLDSDGAITVREIHLYLQRKVHEQSGGNQTPQLYGIGDMVVVRVK